MFSIPPPRDYFDVTDAIRIRPLQPDGLASLLQRLMIWQLPRLVPSHTGHWIRRALPALMAHVSSPQLSKRRWEQLSVPALENLLRDWLVAQYGRPVAADYTTYPSYLLSELSHVCQVSRLATTDMTILCHELPVPQGLLSVAWHDADKLSRMLAMLDLPTDWPGRTPPDEWHARYLYHRLQQLGFPWTPMLTSLTKEVQCRYPLLRPLIYRQPPQHPGQVFVLVEGKTEEQLLPVLARRQYGLDTTGWRLWSVGGKNQMLASYRLACNWLTLPMVLVLDADAEPMRPLLEACLQTGDRLCIFSAGELEDMLPADWLADTLNQAYDLHPPVTAATFNTQGSRVAQLKLLWRTYQLGHFDKSVLAGLLQANTALGVID